MKLRNATRNAMISALRAVQLYTGGELDEEETWDDVMARVNEAVRRYQGDAERPEGSRPFDGVTYNPGLDEKRLRTQLGRVFEAMSTGRWRTLESIISVAGGTAASISARLRDLAKVKHGAWIKDERRVRGRPGLWEYQIRNPDGTEMPPVRPDALSENAENEEDV